MNTKWILRAGAAVIALFAVTAGATIATAQPASPQAAGPNLHTAGLISITVTKYGSVLADRSGRTLYLLADESSDHIHCNSSSCFAIWPPLEISKGTKISVGAGVKGHIGTIGRSNGLLQVTFNDFPVYTYSGDSGSAQTHGEGIMSFGSTWFMLRPSATTGTSTPVK